MSFSEAQMGGCYCYQGYHIHIIIVLLPHWHCAVAVIDIDSRTHPAAPAALPACLRAALALGAAGGNACVHPAISSR